MSLQTNVGYADTAISGVSTLPFPRGLVNFGADFRVKSNTANEVVLTNLSSPVDRPERFRISITDITNVYQGTDIDPSVFSPSKKGISLLVQLTEVISVTDTVDPTFRVDLPLQLHFVAKLPSSPHLTSAMIMVAIGRLVTAFFETGSLLPLRLDGLVRGSLLPSDV